MKVIVLMNERELGNKRFIEKIFRQSLVEFETNISHASLRLEKNETFVNCRIAVAITGWGTMISEAANDTALNAVSETIARLLEALHSFIEMERLPGNAARLECS